jgi:GAF domain-containing protein
VTLSRKEAKSRRRITGLRSKTTKASTHVDRLRAANADLTKKLAEAREQQTATSDVLKVISRSTFDLQTVLDTLVESATRLCNADHAWLFQREGEFFRWVTSFGHAAEVRARLRDYFKPLKVPVDRGSITGRAALEGRVVHVPDVLADPDYTWTGAQEIGGYRTALGAPLLRKGDVVGVIFVAKTAPQPFTAKQIELVTTFADQAVIAIENTRLLNELHESLQQQTATADVLKVISRSAFDLQTVLDTLVESAVRLCEARFGAVFRLDHGLLHLAAQHNFDEDLGWVALIKGRYPMAPNRGHISGRAILTGGPVQIPDILADHEYQGRGTKDAGFRSLLGVPLLREGGAIGAIVIYRKEPGAFTDKQLALLQTFADQAVIAIENARLLSELRQRTTDLSKALDQQTATSEVLQSISSSPGELEPVFQAILVHATRLCEAKFGSLYLRKEDAFRAVAMHGPSPIVEWLQREPVVELRDHPHIPLARVAQSKEVLHIRDLAADQAYIERDPRIVAVVELGGYRTVLWVPMLKEGELIGVIVIYRLEVRPFSAKQIELVQNFASARRSMPSLD